MRKPILLLAGLALATGACSSSSSTPYAPNPAPPDHHYATAAPYEPEPLPTATPVRRGHVRGPRRQPAGPRGARPDLHLRPGRRHRGVLDRPALRRRRQPPRPGVGPRRGVRQRLRPGLRGARGGRVRDQRRRRPQPVPPGGRGPVPGRRPGEAALPPGAPGRVADVRHRHLRLDGPRGPARARQAVARLPRRPAPLARHRRDRRVRLGRAGRAGAHPGHRCGPDLRGHRLAGDRRLDQRRGRPAAGLPGGRRVPPRGRHQPRRSSPRTASRTSVRSIPRRSWPGSVPTRRRGSSS